MIRQIILSYSPTMGKQEDKRRMCEKSDLGLSVSLIMNS